MYKFILVLVLAACSSPMGEVVPAECDNDILLCEEGMEFCDGDPDAYVVCGRDGAYCRKLEGFVDGPVDNLPLCVR